MSRNDDQHRAQPADYKRSLKAELAKLSLAEQPLQVRERLARVILDEMYQFTGLMDPSGVVLEANRPALRGGGVERNEVLGRLLWETHWFQTSPEAVADVREAVQRAAAGEFVRYEVTVFGELAGAEPIVIDFSLSPVYDETGEIAFLLAEGRNINEKKLAEQEVARKNDELRVLYERLKELDQLKTEFFANVSHELRTPLTLILAPARHLLSEDDLPPQDRHELEVIERNAGLLLKQVNALLDLSKLEAGRMRLRYAETDLAALVRLAASQFEILAHERGIPFELQAPAQLTAQVDPEKIQQVLLNLLSNAFKFTAPRGPVRLVLEQAGSHARLRVEDSGPGVPEPLREAIFERFRQIEGGANRRVGGTGLGLSIIRRFVELHQGRVAVSDAPAGGACFTVELPLAAPETATVETAPPELGWEVGQYALAELRNYVHPEPRSLAQPAADEAPLVLVVEDNPDMNEFLATTLARHYRVATAFDGAEGLRQATELMPDLILSDVMIPNLSGDQMVRQLRRHETLRQVPIMMLTAKADPQLQAELLREGVQDYLYKPFRGDELLARVERLLAERARTEETLRESEARFRGTFENAAVGMAHLDLDGRWLRVNETLCNIVGYSRDELLQLRFQDLTYPEDLPGNLQMLAHLLQERLPSYAIEKRYHRKDGTLVWVSVSASLMRSSSGKPEYLIAVIRDISPRKAAEAQLQQLNETLEQQVAERTALAERRTRQLRRLASELTQVEQRERRRLAQALHDHLQQILATARMFLSPIHKQLSGTPLDQRLDQVDQLLNQSITVSRSLAFDLSSPILHDAGLAAALGWLARNMKASHQLDVQLTADPRANPTAEYTAELLYQAVRELLLNVARHSGTSRAEVRMSRLKGDQLQIVVQDQGRGFDTSFLADGSPQPGFGLFSIRERLELLGGELQIESGAGQGAKATITAPLAEPIEAELTLPRDATASAAQPGRAKPTRVLLVDDHKIVRRGLVALLEELPELTVIGEAADGAEAIELARRLRPDVVVMDITMPGMDGLEATRRLKEEFPHLRVVGLSMHEAEELDSAMQAAGACALFAKGEPLDSLTTAILGTPEAEA